MSDNHDLDLSKAHWFKSARSSAAKDCVEVAFLPGSLVGVRDSKNSSGPALVFGNDAWTAFTTTIASNSIR
ncbi:DUF397 domain-containing protein [Nocardia australiensis]|uniref:DUF397 domain-containing protein n=1 Tax=Nocardia australiensis TaxID=2887191 RepID=UPI001D14B172|nr:DUF397 domain-containing protein [Nocardia australiensis]